MGTRVRGERGKSSDVNHPITDKTFCIRHPPSPTLMDVSHARACRSMLAFGANEGFGERGRESSSKSIVVDGGKGCARVRG
jgi:hypothetical protein